MFGLGWTALLKYGAIILAVIGVIAGAYYVVTSYNTAIEEKTQLENEKKNLENEKAQLEQTISDKDFLLEQMDKVRDTSRKVLADTSVRNTRAVERHTNVERYIDTPEAKASNRESSEVIKNTIRMLANEE